MSYLEGEILEDKILQDEILEDEAQENVEEIKEIKRKYISVTQLNNYVKTVFDSNSFLKRVVLRGQVSNFTNHQKTGHYYFVLKDKESSVRAIMFNEYASKLMFNIKDGMDIVVTGSVQVFVRNGMYQIYCTSIEPYGIGLLHLEFERLKGKLYKEGLFDSSHKKKLPIIPTRIGVITSKESAAFADIKNVMSRRFPVATIVLFDTLVQGEAAVQGLCLALKKAVSIDTSSRDRLDVIIIARGGGSIEDLWSFNDERLARMIFDCPIPIITGIGHEIDYTIADYVADYRAATPSAAVEVCTPDIAEIRNRLKVSLLRANTQIKAQIVTHTKQIKECKSKLNSVVGNRVIDEQNKLQIYKNRIVRTLSVEGVLQKEGQLLQSHAKLAKSMETKLAFLENSVKHKMLMVENISPLKVLSRGYSITKHGDKVVTHANQVKSGEEIVTKVSDGEIKSVVI